MPHYRINSDQQGSLVTCHWHGWTRLSHALCLLTVIEGFKIGCLISFVLRICVDCVKIVHFVWILYNLTYFLCCPGSHFSQWAVFTAGSVPTGKISSNALRDRTSTHCVCSGSVLLWFINLTVLHIPYKMELQKPIYFKGQITSDSKRISEYYISIADMIKLET